MKPIKLSKEQTELLTNSPQGFLVYSYLSAYPETSLRKLAGLLGLNRNKCYQLMQQYSPKDTAPTKQGKATTEQVELFATTNEAGQSPTTDTASPAIVASPAPPPPPPVGAVYNVGLSVGDTRYKNRYPPANPAPQEVRLKADGTPVSTHTQLVEMFDEFYKYKNAGVKFQWDGKHIKAIAELEKKLTTAITDQGYTATPEIVVSSFKNLLVGITNKWILNNLSPTTINSKYNEINAQQHREQSTANEYDRIRQTIKNRKR